MSNFASGITVVTGLKNDRPLGFTCQTFHSLSVDQRLITISPSKASSSWPQIKETGIFAVNILDQSQREHAGHFAIPGFTEDRLVNKFDGVEWESGYLKLPRLSGVLAFIVVKIKSIHDGGDHDLVVGQVIHGEVQTGSPLIYFKSKFGNFSQIDLHIS